MVPALNEVLDRIEAAQAIGEAEDAYSLLRAVYSNSSLPIGMRMRAAIEALPFEKPKLAVTAIVDADGGFATRLERAIARSGKFLELAANPQPEPNAEPAPVSAPPPTVPDRRYRRG
jgi:hypothetical protein